MAEELLLTARATLATNGELPRFVGNFGSLEVKDFCEISLQFNNPLCVGREQCVVIISAYTGSGAFYLKESFESGMLHHWGWAEKFKLEKHGRLKE